MEIDVSLLARLSGGHIYQSKPATCAVGSEMQTRAGRARQLLTRF